MPSRRLRCANYRGHSAQKDPSNQAEVVGASCSRYEKAALLGIGKIICTDLKALEVN